MSNLFRSYGIPDKLVNEIYENYANTKEKVYLLDDVSK